MDINTLKRYIYILEETYIIKIVPPFFTNKKKEIVKAPKIYFIDPSAKNYFVKDFAPFDLLTDKNFIFENFLFSEFQKKWTTGEKLDTGEIKMEERLISV